MAKTFAKLFEPIEHYVRRAKGGVGLIIGETAFVAFPGGPSTRMIEIHDDKFLPGLRNLAQQKQLLQGSTVPSQQSNVMLSDSKACSGCESVDCTVTIGQTALLLEGLDAC